VRGVLKDARMFNVAVRNERTGELIPAQVTNFDPNDRRELYNDLLFQHSFAAGEKSARFVLERTEKVVPPFPQKVFARYVPERLDDFAFENDRLGHRMYGQALDTPAAGKSRMISSGIDVWTKRVDYPIIDRWYNKGHDSYHVDNGEGLDFYSVGTNRGMGGTGVWDGTKLHVSHNWKTWKVLANGPIEAVFELGYAPWHAGAAQVTETKRITVDAGRNFHRVESTFEVVGADEITVAIGVTQHATAPNPHVQKNEQAMSLSLWEKYEKESEGQLGTAVILGPRARFAGFAQSGDNHLILAKVRPGETLEYHVGAGWQPSGQFRSREEWEKYVSDFAARSRAPLRTSLNR
jgi:hypothetical protein